ncbi:MAG TPA: hypothetical protein VMM15_21180 [Bradyrhizobium sp.]|nr:hypothetical protein [Bradyrhizobium sp.]
MTTSDQIGDDIPADGQARSRGLSVSRDACLLAKNSAQRSRIEIPPDQSDSKTPFANVPSGMQETAALQRSPQFSCRSDRRRVGFDGREWFAEDPLRGPTSSTSSRAVMRIPPAGHDPSSERIRHAIICQSISAQALVLRETISAGCED